MAELGSLVRVTNSTHPYWGQTGIVTLMDTIGSFTIYYIADDPDRFPDRTFTAMGHEVEEVKTYTLRS